VIIGSKVQEEVNEAFLARWNGDTGDQGYLIGLSTVLHAVTDMLVGDMLPQFAGKGAKSDSIPMEYVAQLLIQSLGVGMNLKEMDDGRYHQTLGMAMRNLQELWVVEALAGENEDESE